MSAVLITVQNNTVDYSTNDRDTQVVIVDFDQFNPDTSFPDDVDAAIREVMTLPEDTPWRGGVVKRLAEVKRTITQSLHTGEMYRKAPNGPLGSYELPGSDAGGERQPEEAAIPV